MPKIHLVLFLLLFISTTIAQSSLMQYGTAGTSGTTIFKVPLSDDFYLTQIPNRMNGLFADESCSLCPTGQQSIAENFTVNDPGVGLSHLVMWGGYYPENIPNPVDDFTLIIRSDNGGSPGAVLDMQSGIQPTSREPTGFVLFGCNEYEFTFD